jgi:hypothetical protein
MAAQVVQAFIDAHGIAQPVAQVAAGEIFHGQILMIGQGPEIVDLGDGAMRDAGNDFVFALKALGIVQFARRFAAAHDFEHHVAPQAFAARQKHRGEVAGGDLLDDGIARNAMRGASLAGAMRASAPVPRRAWRRPR